MPFRYNAPVPTVSLNLPNTSYRITVEPGRLARAGDLLRELTQSSKAGIVTDSNVGPLHLRALTDSLNIAGFETISHVLPAGENHKTLLDLAPTFDTFLNARIERSTPIIALGGGVIGDMTGFLAAALLRGVPFVQIPTTLLAMVDASVGGKTGINHAAGKNLIGAFHQPIAVLIDPTVLQTLAARELRSGLAECIKHDLIRDADGFTSLEQNIGRALSLDIGYLTELVAHNVAIKARVVEADPFEKAERAHLNFGHTFGHAIESVSKYAYSHGESIALGMAAAAYTSLKLGLIDATSHRRIIAVIERAGLPVNGLKLDVDAIVNSMAFDKKVADGRIRFVLLDRIGRAVIRDDIPGSLVIEAVQTLREA